MFLIFWAILGALSGLFANKVVYRDPDGLVGDCVIGLVGGFVGGFMFNVVGGRSAVEMAPWSLASAVMGALLMIGAFHAMKKMGHGSRGGT